MGWNNSLASGGGIIKADSFGVSDSTGTLGDEPSLIRLIGGNVRGPAFIFLVMVALSLPLRLVNLQAPFSGEHQFRQTQTALSVWEIREHGFSLLHPRLPLFGPPWECPFEYPVFQLVAAAVDSIAPWTNLDVSIRVTNLIFFYLTALMLALLARMLFVNSAAALFTAAVFLFSPYNVFWSRTSMIEYAATFFGLAYLVSFIRWSFEPRRTLFALTLLLGILGCLTKATSFVIPLVTAGTLAGLHVLRLIWPRHSSEDPVTHSSSRATSRLFTIPSETQRDALSPAHVLALAILLIVPLLVGYLYIRFGDAIKEQSPYTAWLSSSHPYTRDWTYGTWAQRLRLRTWEMLGLRIQHTIMPSLAVAMVIGLCALPFRTRQFGMLPRGNFWIGCSLALAPLIGILLFYNLYVVHTYYLIACAPFIALFAGVGLTLVFNLMETRIVRLLFLLFLIGLGLQEWSGRLGAMLGSPIPVDGTIKCLSEVARFIKKDEPVIVLSGTEWSAFAPYYMKRRAFMAMLVNKPVNIQPFLDQHYFKKNGFHWLLREGDSPGMQELTARIINQWKIAHAISLPAACAPYVLYSLSDE